MCVCVIDHVIDNTSSWDGIYPLANTYLDQPTASFLTVPITVNQVLQECGQSGSAVEALQLGLVLDIKECLTVPTSLVVRKCHPSLPASCSCLAFSLRFFFLVLPLLSFSLTLSLPFSLSVFLYSLLLYSLCLFLSFTNFFYLICFI